MSLDNAINDYNDTGLLRIDTCVPILKAQEYRGGQLQECIEEIFNDNLMVKVFGADFDYEEDESDEDPYFYENICDNLNHRYQGCLLAKVSTPVFHEGSSSFTWGHTTYHWIIGKDLEDLIVKGLKWKDAMKPRKKPKPKKR